MAFPPKKKSGLDIIVGVGGKPPMPPKGMAGAPKYPGQSEPDGDEGQDSEDASGTSVHCPACGTKLKLSAAPDEDTGDDMSDQGDVNESDTENYPA